MSSLESSLPGAREAEPWRFARESLELIDAIAERVGPDEPELRSWLDRYRRQHRSRLAADLRLVERHVAPGARILEVGAVPLLITGALAELGYEVVAVDVAPERFAGAIAELGLAVERCDVETEPLPFADARFDAVLFNELFEHLRIDPSSFRGLRNLVTRHRASTASGGVYEQYEKLETLGHMGHVREYTAAEVADFLTRVGFRVEKVIYRGGHGRGVVGLAERVLPALRPFFTLIATPDR